MLGNHKEQLTKDGVIANSHALSFIFASGFQYIVQLFNNSVFIAGLLQCIIVREDSVLMQTINAVISVFLLRISSTASLRYCRHYKQQQFAMVLKFYNCTAETQKSL